MVKAESHFKLLPTSLLDTEKVFEHIDMLFMGPRGDSYNHIYQHAPAELLAVRYGEAVADGSILVPTSFLQVQETFEMFPWFSCHMFLCGPTWDLKGYLLGLMNLDIREISGYSGNISLVDFS